MTVIHRYIVSMFMKYCAIVLVMVVLIYLAIDFFSRMGRFIDSPVTGYEMFLYFAYKTPLIIAQITPIGVLLGVLTVFGLMNRNNEIIALKSGGISMFYLLKPVAALGVIFTIALFLFSETVVPVSISKSSHIDSLRKGRGVDSAASSERNIWIRHTDGFAHARYFQPRENVLFDVSLYYMGNDYGITRRIDARKAEYIDEKWVFYEAMVQNLEKPDKDIEVDFREMLVLELDLELSDFQQVSPEPEATSFLSLYRYIQRVERAGYEATGFRVDFYGKTALPFACLIVAVMGAAIALRSKAKDAMVTGFAYGLVLAFAYWIVYSFSLSMGYGGLLPPLLAAWTANLLYGTGTVLLLLYVE